MIQKDEITDKFSKYLEKVIIGLDLYWLPENVTDKIDYATSKFKSYDVILKIKQNFNKREKFSYIDAPVKNHQKYFN